MSPRDFIVVSLLVFSYALVCQFRGVIPKVKFYWKSKSCKSALESTVAIHHGKISVCKAGAAFVAHRNFFN